MNETLLNMPIGLTRFSDSLERTVKFADQGISRNRFNLDTTIDSQENLGKPTPYQRWSNNNTATG